MTNMAYYILQLACVITTKSFEEKKYSRSRKKEFAFSWMVLWTWQVVKEAGR